MRNPVYIYAAALYCGCCGEAIRDTLTREGKAPRNPDDESSYDSDQFPKGPYPDGGGEADSPQHCDSCLTFLENPLTGDGLAYVREAIAEWPERGNLETLATWRDFYARELVA